MPSAPQTHIGGHRWANKNNPNVPQPTKVTFYPQNLGLFGCSKIGTEVNEGPNQYGPSAYCGLDKTVAWPESDDGRRPPESLWHDKTVVWRGGGGARFSATGGGGGLGWVGLAASCRSRPSGVGFLPYPTTRLNYLTVRFQGRADYRQPPNPTEAQVGGRYRRPVCRRVRGQGCGRGLGLARGGQVWPGAPGPVGQAVGA